MIAAFSNCNNKHSSAPAVSQPATAYVAPNPVQDLNYNTQAEVPPAKPIQLPKYQPNPLPDYPECALPYNGIFSIETTNKCVAKFVVHASQLDNYYMKLEDAFTKQCVLTLFIRAGTTAEIRVPLGSYIIKYASGDKWYGTEHLFGPRTSYSKAETIAKFTQKEDTGTGYTTITGHSITLYKVTNGNLHTESISKNEF